MRRAIPLLFSFLAVSAFGQPLPEHPVHIGYSSPDAALAGLRARQDLVATENDQWFIFEDKAAMTLWTITKPNHPAYPSVVMRQVKDHKVNTSVLCDASKDACDYLVRQYQELIKRESRTRNDMHASIPTAR